jgi:hypothetical protein
MAEQGETWSVGSLMKASLYAAVNFAVFRAVSKDFPISYGIFLYVIFLLAILNLLFFWFSRWHRGRADRKFWDWFELVGWGMIGLDVTFADWSSNLIVAPMNWLVERDWIMREGTLTSLLYILGLSIVYGLCPLAVAAFAGWMAARSGRSTPAEGESPGGSSPHHFGEEARPAAES